MENPDIVPEPDRQLGRNNCDDHDDDQRDRSEAGEKTGNDQSAADGLDDADEGPVTSA